jgi:anti-sigma B factor antagonist
MDHDNRVTAAGPEIAVVPLPYDIDYSTAARAGEALAAAFEPGVRTIVADLTRCGFIDTTGIREVALAHRRAAAGRTELRLVIPQRLQRLFVITGLDNILKIYPDLGAALCQSPRGQSPPGQSPPGQSPPGQPPPDGPASRPPVSGQSVTGGGRGA